MFTMVYTTTTNIYVLVKVPAGVLHGNYWARGKFTNKMEDDEHVALDPNFIPEGWLLDYPSSPANSKHLPPRMKVLYNCSIISQTVL